MFVVSAHGYRRVVSVAEQVIFSEVRGKDGERHIAYRSCARNVSDTERYRVPIDPAAETRKRDNLIARKAALTKSAMAAVNACKAAYPEEGSRS